VSSNNVITEKNGPVTTVILRRPHARNAVDRATAAALAEAFLAFEHDGEARVGVLYGDHGTFCAGADLKAVAGSRAAGDDAGSAAGRADAPAGNRIAPPAVGDAFDPLATDGPMGPSRMLLSKPVIAAVAGHAVAGGLELALWCDLRVVEEDAVFGVFCRRWGVPLLDGGTIRLPRIVGMGRALDLILTGRPVMAEEALRMGLANRVVERGRARQEAERLALEISRFPQLCLRSDRRSAYEQWDLPLDRALLVEYRHGLRTLESGEAREGARRFAAGRGRGGRFDDL
jgi:enoyl-CoA hydratase